MKNTMFGTRSFSPPSLRTILFSHYFDYNSPTIPRGKLFRVFAGFLCVLLTPFFGCHRSRCGDRTLILALPISVRFFSIFPQTCSTRVSFPQICCHLEGASFLVLALLLLSSPSSCATDGPPLYGFLVYQRQHRMS